MKFYHGTDLEITILKKNSYITRNFKDACKFGYRKSVLSNSLFVYIYMVDVEEDMEEGVEEDVEDTPGKFKFLKKDQNRDRAYMTLFPIAVELKCKYLTYQTPYKLKKFKMNCW